MGGKYLQNSISSAFSVHLEVSNITHSDATVLHPPACDVALLGVDRCGSKFKFMYIIMYASIETTVTAAPSVNRLIKP